MVEASSISEAGRPPGSLRGAAEPFIRRRLSPDEEWDEAVERAAAEDWRMKTEPDRPAP